jgi:hypothetical protein
MIVATNTAVPALRTAARATQYSLSVRLENQSASFCELFGFSITGLTCETVFGALRNQISGTGAERLQASTAL